MKDYEMKEAYLIKGTEYHGNLMFDITTRKMNNGSLETVEQLRMSADQNYKTNYIYDLFKINLERQQIIKYQEGLQCIYPKKHAFKDCISFRTASGIDVFIMDQARKYFEHPIKHFKDKTSQDIISFGKEKLLTREAMNLSISILPHEEKEKKECFFIGEPYQMVFLPDYTLAFETMLNENNELSLDDLRTIREFITCYQEEYEGYRVLQDDASMIFARDIKQIQVDGLKKAKNKELVLSLFDGRGI